jgi:trans-aconitate 2-methyltransferase
MPKFRSDWNPELYLKFDRERTQPSIDLVSHIHLANPQKIIDIGCGPGNSTQVLVQRWPDARVSGVDNSPAMIEKAKSDFPDQDWIIMDAGKDEMHEKFDLVFSNATIQWIPNHAELLRKFHTMLTEKGVMAVQLPLFWDMPVGKAIAEIAGNPRWNTFMAGVMQLFTIHDDSFYYDQLSSLFSAVEIWESSYMHILDSPLSILEMIRGAGLRPFLNRLENPGGKMDFEEEVLKKINEDYPSQKNGKVIFPFRRLFFVAYK